MSESATFDEAIDERIKFRLDDVHTFFPAEIISVRPDGLVDIQPKVKVIFPGTDQETELPEINKAVLMQTRNEGAIIRLPKESHVGTKVGVLISEHSLTEWRQTSGGSFLPEEARRFDINDAVALLGFYPETVPWGIAQLPNTLEIQVASGKKISIGDGANSEVLNLLYNLVVNMLAGVVDPVSGNLPFVNSAKITQLNALLAQITNVTVL
jgi:hypothetical protein